MNNFILLFMTLLGRHLPTFVSPFLIHSQVFAQTRAQPQCRFWAHCRFIVHLAACCYDLTQRCFAWCWFRCSIFGFSLSVNLSETSFMKQMHYAVFACHKLCLVDCRYQFLYFLNLSFRSSVNHPNVLACKYFPTKFFWICNLQYRSKQMRGPMQYLCAVPNARPWCGDPLSNDFLTSSSSVDRVTVVVERRYSVQQ